MICFRNCDRRWPYFWESADQPEGRWHGSGEGPAQYLADTPDGAWAEFLRHEEIEDEIDLAGVARALWAVEIEINDPVEPELPNSVMTGGLSSYDACQREAARLRTAGERTLVAPSAALKPGGAAGYRVELGFRYGPPRNGIVIVCFGRRPDAVGWSIVDRGQPPAELLKRVQAL